MKEVRKIIYNTASDVYSVTLIKEWAAGLKAKGIVHVKEWLAGDQVVLTPIEDEFVEEDS